MLMNSGKNLLCRKSERQLKFRVLDRGVKKHNMFYVLCKKARSRDDDEEFDGDNNLIIDW